MSVTWHDSPRGLAKALVALVDQAAFDSEPDFVRRAVLRTRPWSLWSLAEQIEEAPAADGQTQVRRACEAIRRLLPGRSWGIGDAGQFDWRTVAAVLSSEQNGGSVPGDGGRLRLMHELRLSAGPTIMLPDEIHLSERPLRLRLDDRGRPHSEEGPAIAYPDGFAVWAIDGVAVPRWLLVHPERLTADAILAQRNAEVRRVMLDRFGMERFVSEGHAELIADDDRGRLWRMGPPAAGKVPRTTLVMVEVLNATPEPDGSFRTYFLRVPPSMTSAHDAVAWTFGMQGGEYSPLRET